MAVHAKKHKMTIPTYIPKKANDLPMFFENKPYQGASGKLYPIPYSDGITDEKKNVEYDVITLENEYIKTQVLPAAGGKILRGYDKIGNHDFIYYNEVIKPALVGLAGAWISGGIEFNWPQHHRPTTFMSVESQTEENPDGGKTVWVGEVEPLDRQKAMVGITLDEGRSYIKAKVRVYNRTSQPQVFMWWANLAVPVNDNYRTVFPPDCEWVNDHDRRAVLSWPIAKGVYKTARPYDFGEGTDLSRYSAVKVPSSYLISQGQSDMDFIAGYDMGVRKGIATVANHHIAPGKKMWHWGIGDFGDMWCNNLTDENGPYIELMTGVYTDNQPDFTWIAPYESREFEQYWYPIRDIGEVKNATVDAALNMEQRGDDLFFGFNVTGVFQDATIRVAAKDRVLFTETTTLTPEQSYLSEIPLKVPFEDVTVSLISNTGKVLVSYTPYARGQKQPIDPRQPVVRPSELKTVEELYINGYHLEQYKQHNYKPETYYLEGLHRDPGDIRCNTSMGRLSLKYGQFQACADYCDAAIKRLTLRNEHPTDTEAFYLKGLALIYLGRDKDAYDILYKAAWNYTHRSAALFHLACLDCKKGDYTEALRKLEESIGLNKGHTKAQNLKTAILRQIAPAAAMEHAKKCASDDLLDLFAMVEYSHFADNREAIRQFAEKAENILDVVCDYMAAGFTKDALYTLELFTGNYPLIEYYKAYLTGNTNDLSSAESMETGCCFPSRLEDIAVLRSAVACGCANACYYLGCLYYDRFRYQEAAELWEECVRRDHTNGKAWRNLALYWFDKAGNAEKAKQCMEKALAHKGDDPRLLLEYQQLLKNMNCTPELRLSVYEKYPELLKERDDCYLDMLTLVSQTGDYQTAISLAKAKRFHIYEGGEGKLTKQHAWMHVLYGNRLFAEGQHKKAEKIYQDGLHMPKSYGEAKTFFNQEAHIYYCLGTLYEKTNQQDLALTAYENAAIYKAAVSEISLFRALALKKLGRIDEADRVLDEMLEVAQKQLDNKDLRTYYGVGSPSPMPFELDIVKNNTVDGSILKAYALLGKEKIAKAEAVLTEARALSPYDFRIYAFDQIK